MDTVTAGSRVPVPLLLVSGWSQPFSTHTMRNCRWVPVPAFGWCVRDSGITPWISLSCGFCLGGGAFPATRIPHVLPAAWGTLSHDLPWSPKFLCTAVFQKWLDLMAWDVFLPSFQGFWYQLLDSFPKKSQRLCKLPMRLCSCNWPMMEQQFHMLRLIFR